MYIAVCDRCGREKKIQSLLPVFGNKNKEDDKQPKYTIMSTGDTASWIYLCENCEKDFDIWLHEVKNI